MLLRVISAVLLVLALLPTTARAATPYDSLYQFESAFLGNLQPGDTGSFSVFFANTGTTAWVSGTSTQVNLAACRDDKTTCGVAPEESAWNPGSWLSATAYARHTKTTVAPGDFSAFTYAVKVPANVALGIYRFNGDLVLAATGAKLHPEGYYQDATVTSLSAGIVAPTDVQVQVANLDNGPRDNDIRIFFNAPSTNPILPYEIQRAPGGCPVANDSPFWTTAATITLVGGVFGSYNDYDRPNGFHCYQVRVKNAAGAFLYSNQVQAAIFGPSDISAPISTSVMMVSSGGFPNTLDAGDQFSVTFDKAMALQSFATIRVTDADCGAPASQSSGPASCTAPATQTTADITCGTNASCALSLDAKVLTVTMTGNPIDVVPGAAPGVQLPAVIVSASGISAQTGSAWSIVTSSDRVIN